MSTSLSCAYASLCSGCDWIAKPYSEQKELKLSHFNETWAAAHGSSFPLANAEWVAIAGGGLRDRADLMIDSRSGSWRMGLFARDQQGIVDLESCAQMSPALEAWLKDFRKIPVPVERGSVRLRVSPSGVRGVWLDLANVDVKRLLDERTTLNALREHAIVEIGQKRKRLVEKEGLLKLTNPVLEPWFETYTDDGNGSERATPLYCTVGSFTQPGFRANQALVREVRMRVAKTGANTAAEFGSGVGNFTLPLASITKSVRAYEVDALALEGLERSAIEQGLSKRIEIYSGNYQVARKQPVDFTGVDLVLVDPPRSGLMKFLDPLEQVEPAARPSHFVYVSCFAESFATDSMRLKQMGYKIQDLSLVDQFPQSRHYEIVASFRL